MQQLEIIEIRTVGRNQKSLEQFLTNWLEQVQADENKRDIRIYKHKSIETDFSIHIQQDTKTSGGPGELGEHLGVSLRDFGLVNGSVWLEFK